MYALLAPRVLRLLRRLLPAADAEDVLQNTFADVWRSRTQYDGARPLRAWVFGIARHRCADVLRTRVPEPIGDLVDREEAGDQIGDGMAERVVRAQLLRDALRTLPVEQREVLVLAYFRQLTQREDRRLARPAARDRQGPERPGTAGGCGGPALSGPGGGTAMTTTPADGHLGDLVVDLADGNLAGADPALALAHLDNCPECRAELADAVVAAAALREFSVPAPPPVPAAADGAMELPAWTPPAAVEPVGNEPVGNEPVGNEPVGNEPVGNEPVGARRRPAGRRAVALAAAVALLAGVGIGGGVSALRDNGRPPPTAVTLLLRSGASPRGAAVLTAAGDTRRMTIAVDGVPVPSGTVLLVWLSGGNSGPLRVGTLDAGGRGTFGMSAETASRFAEVVLTDQTPESAGVMDSAAIVASAALNPGQAVT